jgi:NTP pyrophosphatase (non-canonical NTP hydrolase)
MGLDEYPEAKLIAELEERRAARRRGLCDYCGRQLRALPFCLMEDRHSGQVRRTMSVEQFHAMNVRRCEEGFGHKFTATDDSLWSPADWMTAIVGELGELANLLKKIRRGEEIPCELVEQEWADTFTYLDLLAEALGINPMAAVLRKFDEVSDRVGWER